MSEDAALSFKTGMEFAYGEPSPMGPGVVRIVAPNPGPFTFKGTNTYLVGSTVLAVVDPGPSDDAHRAAILAVAAGRPISHILITHAHRDHIDGAAALASATGAETCAFPRAGAALVGAASSPSGKQFVNTDFIPSRPLADGDVIESPEWSLTALYTPGHAPDHVCFALAGRGIVFSGDHVMAWNTSVIAPPEGSMADYMASLERLLDRSDKLYLPGHGGRIEEPMRTVKAYLIHRRWREQAIVEAIAAGNDTIRALVPVVYQGIREDLGLAAAFTVQAHVEHLIGRGLATFSGPPTWDCRISLA